MPEISRFLGISILMYFNDHLPPHFHVKYNEYRGSIDINSLSQSEGKLPGRVLGIVIEWAEMHKQELIDNWNTIMETGFFKKITPLV